MQHRGATHATRYLYNSSPARRDREQMSNFYSVSGSFLKRLEYLSARRVAIVFVTRGAGGLD